jgi:methionine aminopeptidase
MIFWLVGWRFRDTGSSTYYFQFFVLLFSDVCTKYQEASKIVNLTLEGLVQQCVPGAKILDLCEFGHTVMETKAAKLYQKKDNGRTIDRGVAFPVCISVNDVVCNHSPLPTEERVSHSFIKEIQVFRENNPCLGRYTK